MMTEGPYDKGLYRNSREPTKKMVLVADVRTFCWLLWASDPITIQLGTQKRGYGMSLHVTAPSAVILPAPVVHKNVLLPASRPPKRRVNLSSMVPY